MDKMHTLLLKEAERLAALIFMIMLGQAYSMRAYLRELAELESNLRVWLIGETRAFMARHGPAPAPPSVERRAAPPLPAPRKQSARASKGSPTLGFRILSIERSPRPDGDRPAPLPPPPHHIWIHYKHQAVLNRLDALRRVIDNPAPVIAYLARKLAPIADALATSHVYNRPYSEEMIKLATLQPGADIARLPWRPDS